MAVEQKNMLSTSLKELRIRAGMKQEEIAKEFFVSRECWSNYERGIRMPSIETLYRIAVRFDEDIKRLIGGGELSEDTKAMLKSQKDLRHLLTTEGGLDISKLPLSDKISLMHFYKYLVWKHKHNM